MALSPPWWTAAWSRGAGAGGHLPCPLEGRVGFCSFRQSLKWREASPVHTPKGLCPSRKLLVTAGVKSEKGGALGLRFPMRLLRLGVNLCETPS